MAGGAEPLTSRAVLVGTSRYDLLGDIGAVHNNLDGLAEVLRAERFWGLPADHCVAVEDPATAADMLDPVVAAALSATDTLLFYYAGHGLLDPRRGELHLALTGSDPQRIYTAVPYAHVRDALLESRAVRRVVILDCCYSGRALGQMASIASVVVDEASAEGTYVLAATAENKTAKARPGERYTDFTGELLAVIRHGIPGCGPLLDLDSIYQHVRAAMRGKGLEVPQKRDRNTAGELALIRNQAYIPSMATPAPGSAPVVTTVTAGVPQRQAGEPQRTAIAAPSPVVRDRRRRRERPTGRLRVRVRVPTGLAPPSRLRLLAAAGSCLLLALGVAADRPPSDRWLLPLEAVFTDGSSSTSVNDVAFSPDGKRLAASFNNASALIWTLTGHAAVLTVTDPVSDPSPVSVAFSPRGNLLAVADSDYEGDSGTVYLWNLAAPSGNPVTITNPALRSNGISRLAFNPSGTVLAVATGSSFDSSRTVAITYLWDVAAGKFTSSLADPGSSACSISGVAFSPDGKYLAVASCFPYVFDLATSHAQILSQCPGAPEAQGAAVMAFSPDGKTLAIAIPSTGTALLALPSGNLLATLTDPGSDSVNGSNFVAFSPDGKYLAVGDGNGYAYMWNAATRQVVAMLPGTGNSVNAVAFSPDGTKLAVGGDDGIDLWNTTRLG